MLATCEPGGSIEIRDLSTGELSPALLADTGVDVVLGVEYREEELKYRPDENYLSVWARDGSITVIDLQNKKVLGSITTLKAQGFNPNCIVLLPEWNDPMGH